MPLSVRHLYKAAEGLFGTSVFSRLDKLEQLENSRPDAIKAFQDDYALRLIEKAYNHVPFYNDLWKNDHLTAIKKRGSDGLSTLPITNKTTLMAAGNRVIDNSVRKKSLIMGRSSGSTGKRFVYYKNQAHQSWWIATNFLSWIWAGWDFGDRWIRLQYRGKLSRRQRVEDFLFRCLDMPLNKFDDSFLQSFTRRAALFDPKMIRGYSGGTYVYAKWLLQNSDQRLHPKAIVLTGDSLYPHYRETIEEAFSAPIYDTYGGEGITAAIQCSHGTYHIPPIVHIDLIPEGPPFPEGQPHRLIITSLTNTGMPIIRYDIGDLAIPADGPCPCGVNWPGLKKIIGRDTDIIRTPAGRNLVVHHFNNIFRTIDGIDEFQVYQRNSGNIDIILVTNELYNRDRDENTVIEDLRLLAGEGANIKLHYKNSIPVPASGKRRYIISDMRDV